MTMDNFKKYTALDREQLDEFYTPIKVVENHIELSENYLGISKSRKVMTCFGNNNTYTTVLKKLGYDVIEYEKFEDLINDNNNRDRVLIDNPPFSTAQKDRTSLELKGIKYSLFASGTWLPKKHQFGMILLEQPRVYFTNRPEQVLVTIFQNFDSKIYSDYNKKNPNKFKQDFIAVNLGKGVYDRNLVK